MSKLFCPSLFAAVFIFAQYPAHAAGPEIWKGECVHIVGKKVKASSPCTVKVYATATSASEEWEWKGGARTSVKMSDAGTFVNGQPAEKRDASEIIDVELDCLGIRGKRDIFCR